MIRSILIILLVTTITMSYGQDTKTFRKDNISFEYPADWVIRDFPGYYILISEPPKEQMSVMTTFDVSFDNTFKTLNSFCDNYESKNTDDDNFKDFKIKSKEKIEFKGYEAIEYNCTAIIQYLPIEWKSIIFMKEDKVYKLSTTAMVGQFYLLREKTNSIFQSFQIE